MAEAGPPTSREYVFPNLSLVRHGVERCMAITRELFTLPQPSGMKYGQWERAVAEIIQSHLR